MAVRGTTPDLRMETGRTFPVLETERLLLRETSMMDAKQVVAILNEPDIAKLYGFVEPMSRDMARNVIQKRHEKFEEGSLIRWTLARKEDNLCIGGIDVRFSNSEPGIARVGYEILSEFRGQGFMREALTEVIHYTFHRTQVYRLEATVEPHNERSMGLVNRLGFVREGLLRQIGYWQGERHDLVMHSLLRSDNPMASEA